MRIITLFLTTIIGTAWLCETSYADSANAGNTSALAAGKPVKNTPINNVRPARLPTIPAGGFTKPIPNNVRNMATQQSIIQPAGPRLTKAPSHGFAEAVIGGPGGTKNKTTATVSGTGLNHKP